VNNKLRIAGIVRESIADGPGIRYVVFVQGCKHGCKGCHNPDTHALEGGTFIDIDVILNEIDENPLLDGVTLSGGEPFEQAEILSELAKAVKKKGKNVITFTGYTFEYLKNNSTRLNGWYKLLELTDILIDGRYDEKLRNLNLKFRGSENQRIIDIKESIKQNRVFELEL
jgi:anaerobic ribonucleoside-triphosphate reductase activating protein